MTRDQRPTALPVLPDNVPPVLRAVPRWVLWQYTLVERGQRQIWAKVPKQASGRNARSTDPGTWCSFDRALAAYGTGRFDGIGFVFDGTDQWVGVDLDDCVQVDVLTGEPGLNAFALSTISHLPGYWETSPSGTGVKGWMLADGVGSQKNNAKGIEVYADGRYFTVTGHLVSRISDAPGDSSSILHDWVQEHLGSVAPKQHTTRDAASTGDDALDAFLKLNETVDPIAGWSAERVRSEIGPHLDREAHYEDWLNVGMAIHHQFAGSDEGFELWDEIYQGSSKYNGPDYGRERWQSFGRRGPGARPVTLGTLIKKTASARAAAPAPPEATAEAATARSIVQSRVDEYMRLLEGAADAHNVQALIQNRASADKDLSDVDRAAISASAQRKLKALGAPVPINTIRSWWRSGGGGGGGANVPPAMSSWLFLTAEDRFYDMATYQAPISRQAFDMMFDRLVPAGSPYDSAGDMFKRVWRGATLSRRLYAPPYELLFEIDGVQYVNAYNPGSAPAAEPDADVSAVLDQHMDKLLPEPVDRALLLGWMAHNVAHPGVLLGWAPYVCSRAQGTGKSALGRMLAAAMGQGNVGEVPIRSLGDKFTGWATGRAVNILDEVKLHGEDRHNVVNAMKPYITNKIVTIERKGGDAFDAPNFTGYMLFSNHDDGLPVEESDRRYAFFVSPMTTEQVKANLANGHYRRLFDAITEKPGAVRAWLLAQPVPAEVLMQRAPDTTGRARVLEAVEPEAVTAARQVIEAGARGVNQDAVVVSALGRGMKEKLGHRVGPVTIANALETLGFERHSRAFKWVGEVESVWVRSDSSLTGGGTSAVREALEKTGDSTEFDVLP